MNQRTYSYMEGIEDDSWRFCGICKKGYCKLVSCQKRLASHIKFCHKKSFLINLRTEQEDSRANTITIISRSRAALDEVTTSSTST